MEPQQHLQGKVRSSHLVTLLYARNNDVLRTRLLFLPWATWDDLCAFGPASDPDEMESGPLLVTRSRSQDRANVRLHVHAVSSVAIGCISAENAVSSALFQSTGCRDHTST